MSDLQEVYDSLPTIECKGLCWNSCGPIDMSEQERERIRERGVEIEPFTAERAQLWAMDLPLHCAALDWETKRCTVYDVRPLICRLWGVTEGMECPHGCEVSPGMLTHDEGIRLIAESIGYGDEMMEAMNDPELGPLLKRYTEGDHSAEQEIIALVHRRGVQ